MSQSDRAGQAATPVEYDPFAGSEILVEYAAAFVPRCCQNRHRNLPDRVFAIKVSFTIIVNAS